MTSTLTRQLITLPSGFHFYLVEIPGGSYWMGNDDEDAYGDEKIIHEVKVPGFWMAEYPTTQQLWLEVMGGENPAYFQGRQRPIEQVNWYEAAAFCNVLNTVCKYPPKYFLDEKCTHSLSIEQADSADDMVIYVDPKAPGFRLPSEAEWEYAARAGNPNLKYAGSNTLHEVGWYGENSHGQTQAVGLKMPNEWGLYDMSGNVYEWCEDQWHDSYEGAPNDGSAWVDQEAGVSRVIRGGYWDYAAQYCRLSFRLSHHPTLRDYFVGFRVVFSPQSVGLFSQPNP